MNTRSTLMLMALISFSAVSTASAQRPEVDTRLSTPNPLNSEQALKQQGLESATLSRLPLLTGYQGVNLKGKPLQAGDQVYNTLTRSLGTVTGNITVMLDGISAYDLASHLKLNVVYYDEAMQIAQLSAAGQEDILAMLATIQALPEVQFARLDILEALHKPQ